MLLARTESEALVHRQVTGLRPPALEPARLAVKCHGSLDADFEAHLGGEAELATRAAAVADPLLEELVQLVAREHDGLVGGAAVELRAERGRFDELARQVEAEARLLSHGTLGEHDELLER